MRKVYVILATLLMAALVVQFYLAAVGAFAKPQDDKSFALHDLNGMMIIPLLALLATGAAALAKAPGRLIGLTAVPIGLVVVQVLIVMLGRGISGTEDSTTPAGLVVLGLHAINGLAMMGVAGIVIRRARQLSAA
jgi:hypothetical protein